MAKIGKAECQTRIDACMFGDYLYNAGIVRLGSENKLLVQRVSQSAHEGTPYELVPPNEIPDEITNHPKIAIWRDVGFEPASLDEAKALISGETISYRRPSLGEDRSLFEYVQ